MSRPGRVLVIEDREDWREELTELLTTGGFEVVTAVTRAEAVRHLVEELFHLVVLDVRLDEADQTNQQGMEMLREMGRTKALGVIVLSAYGTKALSREAFARYGVFDFQDKQEFAGGEELVESVRRFFTEELRINLGLTINYRGGLDLERFVLNLSLHGERVKRDTPLQRLLSAELEDLLCRLFHTAESLLVSALGGGMSGTGVLEVRPFYGEGGARPVVVKIGGFSETDREFANYTKFVQPFVGGGRSTSALEFRRTPRLGGIAYSLLGGTGDSFEDFAAFYSRAGIEEIAHSLDRLFLDTCSPWYANLGKLQAMDLTRHYVEGLELDAPLLEEALAIRLKSVQGKEKLHFHGLPGARPLPNPILGFGRLPLVFSTYETITHGDFNGHNILLDSEGHSWLIDFQRTGPGHILRDAVQLDAVVRLRLLAPEEATLAERLELEEALGTARTFADIAALPGRLRSDNPPLAKAFATCAHLRGLAARLVASNRASDFGEYEAGSLYCALKATCFFRAAAVQREHALLAASLAAERLSL